MPLLIMKLQELDVLIQQSDEPIARLNQEIEEHKRKHESELKVVGKIVGELQRSRDAFEQQNESIER